MLDCDHCDRRLHDLGAHAVIQRDKWKASQGSRNILGWSFVCECCGFKSHIYKSKATVVAIEDEHATWCPVLVRDLVNVTVINQKAMSKARFPIWE